MSTLGDCAMEVFPLVLGGNTFGWTSDEATAHQVLDAYAGAGGNFLDTADSYSFWVPGNFGGESETIIGSWLAAPGETRSRRARHQGQRAPAIQGPAGSQCRGRSRRFTRSAADRLRLTHAQTIEVGPALEQQLDVF